MSVPLPETPNPCPHCGAPLPLTTNRCPECGKSLRPPLIRFDLPSAPDEALPTLLAAPVWDRLLGATLPFVLSLLCLAVVGPLMGAASVPSASLLAAPFLRFLLPFVATRAFRQRYPHLAGGFRNALSLAKQLLCVHLLIVPLALILLVLGLINGAFHVTGDCFNRKVSYDYQTPLSFAPHAGTAVATLIVQGILASLLPLRITVQKDGIRVARDIGSRVFYGSVATMFLLALAWWLSFRGIASILSVLAALVSAVLAFLRIKSSPELTPRAKLGLTALVVAFELITLGLTALYYSPTAEARP